jgi:alkanesulfonate monooxygenase SsuD/methylene tetrahydromethanopterin reductase-like flavin-dependent oxidoreductase (luciferase family)
MTGQNISIREAAWRFAAERRPFVGTAKQVADEIEHWFRGGACDGFNFRISNPEDFTRFTDEVLPLLRARGLFRNEYEHATLRGHLGLPFPASRYAGTAFAAE